MGWRQGSRLVGGETVELPRLLSLVQAVPVEVRLRVEVVVRGHLLVETKVLHSHRLKHCHHQLTGLEDTNSANPSSYLPMYNLEREKNARKNNCLDLPLCGESSQGQEETIGRN